MNLCRELVAQPSTLGHVCGQFNTIVGALRDLPGSPLALGFGSGLSCLGHCEIGDAWFSMNLLLSTAYDDCSEMKQNGLGLCFCVWGGKDTELSTDSYVKKRNILFSATRQFPKTLV